MLNMEQVEKIFENAAEGSEASWFGYKVENWIIAPVNGIEPYREYKSPWDELARKLINGKDVKIGALKDDEEYIINIFEFQDTFDKYGKEFKDLTDKDCDKIIQLATFGEIKY